MPHAFYDQLGAGYDTIIDWDERLAREGPFLRNLFTTLGVESVLDTACGTGEHAALFASWGLEVVGADISREMIAVCRRKYEGQPVTWIEAGFGDAHNLLGRTFDAVTCLGNSWPHVHTDREAARAVTDFEHLLRPGGVLLLQQLNYEMMRLMNQRLMGPRDRTIDGKETLFLRIFDLDRDPVRFTVVQMTREQTGWTRREWETTHRPWTPDEIEELLKRAAFTSVRFYGDFAAVRFNRKTSEQMICVAIRS